VEDAGLIHCRCCCDAVRQGRRRVCKAVARGGSHNQAPGYVEHLRTETFPALRKIPGFVDVSLLSRPLDAGTEFVVVTRWESLNAITRFAGADAEAAVIPARAAAMMIEYDRRARHFEVIE
jgi:heme-degrading monooxygenase HmoA